MRSTLATLNAELEGLPLSVVSRVCACRFVLPKLELVEVLVGMFVIMGAGVLFF